jgi:hypothetical protein
MQIDGVLDNYLRSEILPQVAKPPFGALDAVRLSRQRPVFLYRGEAPCTKVVGKYFKYDAIGQEEAWHRTEREYSNLKLVRDQAGMKSDRYNVVAPLGRNKVLSSLLILENAPGHNLDHYIAKAIYENRSQDLYRRLSQLAGFFARLHRNSDTGRVVPPKLPQFYLDTVMHSLEKSLYGFNYHESEIHHLASTWWDRRDAFSDNEVIVHGDATPTNFLFHHQKVTGIDLEKMKWADRCWDLGFIAAELKHHFMWRAGDGFKAEPFIGHFLWEYGLALGDSRQFYAITRRIPLYMALAHLRIARNQWLDFNYRYRLIGEAKLCLKYRP